MAEVLSIIGTAGALCNVIDVATKTISTITEIRGRWKEAELVFLGLTTQLTVLRAALSKLQEWMDESPAETHHQLTIDLDVSISYCKLLLEKVEEFLRELDSQGPDFKELDVKGRTRIVLGSQRIDDLEKRIERQTNALTLLLTACNCKTLSEQKQLLEKPKSRRTLTRAKNDSASLVVLRDTSSSATKRTFMTDKLSKVSAVFDFDTEVFSSRVYGSMVRSLLKESLRKRRNPPTATPAPDHVEGPSVGPYYWIGVNLQGLESIRFQTGPIVNIGLLIGEYGPGQDMVIDAVLKEARLISESAGEQSQSYRDRLIDYYTSQIESLAVDINAFGEQTGRTVDKGDCDAVLKFTGNLDYAGYLDPRAVNAIGSLRQITDLGKKVHSRGANQVPYHIDQLCRVSSPQRQLSFTDRFRPNLGLERKIIKFNFCNWSGLPCVLLSCPWFTLEVKENYLKKCGSHHPYRPATVITFVADLETYDLPLPKYPYNRMANAWYSFRDVAELVSPMTRTVFLVLFNVTGFKEKLATSPLETQFPAYSGGSDSDQALEFIRAGFKIAESETSKVCTIYVEEVADLDPVIKAIVKGSTMGVNGDQSTSMGQSSSPMD